MTLEQLRRRLTWAVLASLLAGFLAFMSVTFQETTHYRDAIETCRELRASGHQCMWEDRPFHYYAVPGDDE